MTWSFEKETGVVVKKISARSLSMNRKKNRLVVAAIFIMTFLLALVLSAGSIFFSAQRQESLKLVGTSAEVSLRGPTSEQKEVLDRSKLVKHIGMELHLGIVQNTESRIGMAYIDQAEWEWHRLPLVENFEGGYPQAGNEIMAASWILNDMGIVSPELGMTISVIYFDKDNQKFSKEFILSGYYEDDSHLRSGGKGNIYVSPVYAMSADKMTEILYMDLSGKNRESILQKVRAELNLQSGQYISLSPAYEDAGDTWITMVFLMAVIVLSGYLFIYSFFYLSISKEVKMYGELITIGATKTQIRQIMRCQIRMLIIRGTLAGGIIGFLGSYAVLPFFFNVFFDNKVTIPLFHVTVGTAVSMFLSALTVYISCNKPVRILAGMQPINTIRYENCSNVKCRNICGRKNHIFHMAWRNLWRRRKNACMIILSFTLGCTAFLAVSLFYESIDPGQYVGQYYQYDIEVTDESEEGTAVTGDMVTQMRKLAGVEEVSPVERQLVFMKYDPDIFEKYRLDFQKKTEMDANGLDIGNISEQFWSYAYILPDKSAVNEEAGMVYLSDVYEKMLPIGTKINLKNSDGLDCRVSIAGYIDEEDALPAGGMAPVIYLTEKGRDYICGEWNTCRIGIQCVSARDGEVLAQIRNILPSRGVKIESKMEWENKLSHNMSIFYVVLGGLSLFLLFNSVLNFINTMYSSIQERSAEFRTLSHVGMTEKQLCTMLQREGAIYTIIIGCLVTITTCAGAKVLFHGISGIAPYAEFQFPVIQLIVVIGVIGCICMLVPSFVYKKLRNTEISSGWTHSMR